MVILLESDKNDNSTSLIDEKALPDNTTQNSIVVGSCFYLNYLRRKLFWKGEI
jgi:hypothetical protein